MMGLILFVFNIILTLNFLTQNSLNELEKKVDLIIYLDEEASLYEVTQLVDEIQSNPDVLKVEYTTKETALENFLASYPDQADPFTKYELENPFPGSLRIVTEDPSKHDQILKQISRSPYGKWMLSTESSEENQEIVERLLKITDFTRKLIFGVILSFLFGALIMGMNAIQLSIFTRKTEIQIMQLVGAKPLTIYLPFMLEGVFHSLLALLFSGGLLVLFIIGTDVLPYLALENTEGILVIALLEVFLCTLLGLGASSLAVRLHLKRSLVLDHS